MELSTRKTISPNSLHFRMDSVEVLVEQTPFGIKTTDDLCIV